MNQDEINKMEDLALNLNTDLCILKNALKNGDDNDLELTDLVDFVEKMYQVSDELREMSGNFKI